MKQLLLYLLLIILIFLLGTCDPGGANGEEQAQLANYNRLDFIKKIREEGEHIFDYDKNLIDDMIERANFAKRNFTADLT